jgi:hypothetical protein
MMVRFCEIRRPYGLAVLALQGVVAMALSAASCRVTVAEEFSDASRSVLVGDLAEGQLDDEAEEFTRHESTSLFVPSCVGTEGCIGDESDACQCEACSAGPTCDEGKCRRLADCDPPGLFQRLGALHDKSGACWSGRADALLLWRNAPPDRQIVEGGIDGLSKLNANGMDSTPAAGPRFSLFRTDRCGDAWEVTWLRAANFRSIRPLPLTNQQYVLSPPGLYGNSTFQPFDSGTANLGSRVQSLEFNHHRCHGKHIRWLAGFRWVEWQEQFTLQDTVTTTDPVINDIYQTGCINSMYGGQIGADLYLLSLPWLRVDSVVKAGAYYNNASQASEYTTNDPAFPGTAAVTVGQSPASCAFVGEVGMTGTMPITSNLDIRFGYFGLWLSGIAQPTQQLSGQQLTPGTAASGTLATNGGVLLQGVSLGLEGRW